MEAGLCKASAWLPHAHNSGRDCTGARGPAWKPASQRPPLRGPRMHETLAEIILEYGGLLEGRLLQGFRMASACTTIASAKMCF